MPDLILTNHKIYAIILFVYEMWLSLVERHVRDVEAAGSNPVISTKKSPKAFALGDFFVMIGYRTCGSVLCNAQKLKLLEE